MADKRYVPKLTPEERQELERLTRRGVAAAGKLTRARALLLCDAGEAGPAWTDGAIATALGVTTRSLESRRKRACEEGPAESLERRKRASSYPTKLDGDGEARPVKLACSAPPAGRGRWTLRLSAARLVELEVVESISPETVRQALKKTRSSLGGRRCGASRPGRTPRPSATWSGCSTSTAGRTTRSGRSPAWTSSPGS